MTQLLLALDYLHSNRVLHRDLKVYMHSNPYIGKTDILIMEILTQNSFQLQGSNIFLTKDNDIRLGKNGTIKRFFCIRFPFCFLLSNSLFTLTKQVTLDLQNCSIPKTLLHRYCLTSPLESP